ncbi:uncharacterized protein [Antedon mediterranea]|uniref:uncharacterized protein n=1 Tax=Antedon mediterranea TaxID=105859 RepID=UPI003AF4B96A
MAYMLLLLSIIFCVNGEEDYPFRNTSLPWKDRVDDLVSRLTLNEIILQMTKGGAYNNGPAPAIGRLNIDPYSWNTECLRGDAQAGEATAFPEAIGLAATFSTDIVFDVARATGIEVHAKYNNYTQHKIYGDHKGLSCFSPVINIMRHPLWGRNQETYGEDPYLTGELVKVFVKGLQGDDPRYVLANAGCKHFAAYDGPENVPTSRFSFDAKVSDRDLYMTFLPAFHECIKAGTYSVMCSYNSVNGIPACSNKHLLTTILRDTWGFNGYVVSDQNALEDISLAHKYTSNYLETSILAVKAGCNLELSNFVDNVFTQLNKAVENKNITQSELIDRIKPLFYTRFRLGEFDPVSMNPYTKLDLTNVQSSEHQELAVVAAGKSFVLLKNDQAVLPVKKLGNLAIVGPFADTESILFGDYTPTIDPKYTTTPRGGLSHIAVSTKYAAGCNNAKCSKYDANAIKSAIEGADVIVVCLGTSTSVEKESNDRYDLQLPGHQLNLLQDAVAAANGKPVILLLFNAGPLDVSWAVSSPSVRVIVECFFPAQATGEALRRLFVNYPHSNPAGRLPSTWPASMEQVPPMTNYSMKGRTYRYFNGKPLFEFGYGLSYTTFQYTSLTILSSKGKPCDNATVMVTVANIGNYSGDEVIQLYMRWKNATVPVPRHQLVGFNRTEIQINRSVKVMFTVPPRVMAVYTDSLVIEPGVFLFQAGGQQPQSWTNSVSFEIVGTVTKLSDCAFQG